ncbi:hypothetical protein [Kordia jejudonensis]|uniref:hypothetical protein n=1 Tax=Kordia jejudonensis TaxID=1348245 RepID=UPI0012DFE979|nr:hypothetical protein [Kordia jejudonensis]
MKKRNVKSLSLSKRSISRFNTLTINGGWLDTWHASHPAGKEREWMSLPYSDCCAH